MAFVTSTSKIPTAVVGHACGCLTGNVNHSYVVLNRGNILSFFKVQDGVLAESVAHVQDFRMHCTIKYLHALPIYDPTSKKLVRHVLFLFSTKHEISIVTLDSTREKLLMVTLFYGHLTELYQSRLNLMGQSISCSTSSCPVPVLTPFVAFGVSEGDLYFIDILSAIGSLLQRKKCPHRTKVSRFFPVSVISLMEERGKHEFFIKRPFHPSEFEVRSLAFGSLAEGSDVLPLYVLYADQHFRVHVSEYAFHLNPPATKPAYSLVDYIACAGGTQKLVRKGNLQSNVDPTSSCLLVARDNVISVGSQLLTCVQLSRKRFTRSFELPFLGSVATEVTATTVLPDGDVMVCVLTGACAVVRINSTGDHEPWSESSALSSSPVSRRTAVVSHCPDTGTIATGVLPIGPRMCLLSSNLEDTIVMEIGTWESCCVIDHCGPVIDMTVVNDGATQMVLASTGAERRGGVSALRCVMRLTSELIYQISDVVTSIFAVQDLMLMSSYGKICAAVFLEGQLFEVPFPVPTENEEEEGGENGTVGDAVGLYYFNDTFIFVHEHGLMWLCWRTGRQKPRSLVCKRCIPFTDTISLSDFLDGVLIVATEGRSITCVKNSEIVWTIPTHSTVSAMAMDPSSTNCVIGHWDGTVCILDLSTKREAGRMLLHSVPHSICCVPNANNRGDTASTILVGLVNGYLCETTTSLLIQQRRYRHYFFLMNRPVALVPLQEKNAVIALGPAPMVVLMTAEGCEITGFSVNGVSSCGTLVQDGKKQFVFHSKSRNTLHIGGMESTQKINRTFIPLGGTVTIVRSVAEWAGFVVSLRRNNRESVVFFPNSTIQSPWKEESFSLVQQCELLENEQCTFLDVMTLPHSSEEAVGFSRSEEQHTVVLVGTGFLFRDEQKARSSRIMWFSQGNKGQLHPVGEKDIKGSLQGCCVIPHGKGTVALAVTGIVLLCQWSPREQTFLQREQLCVGLMLFSLMPVIPTERQGKGETNKPSTATIVALDTRHGAFYIEVNIDQGTMKVLSKDHCLRSATAGAILNNGMTLMSDCNDNIFAVGNAVEQIPSTDTEMEAVKKVKLQVAAQMHVGQCINCMQHGSFSPAAVMGEYSQSMRLFRGSMGAQIVYGTADGAFGTITPVGVAFYFVLRSIECAISTVVAAAGSFEPDFFREILIPGQERSFNRKASQATAIRSQDHTALRRRCVDGDVIEGFLGLSVDKRQDVLNVATNTAVRWWPTLKALLEDQESTLDFVVTQETPVPDPEYAQERCNDILTKAELPTLPFADGQVQHLIFDLRRLH